MAQVQQPARVEKKITCPVTGCGCLLTMSSVHSHMQKSHNTTYAAVIQQNKRKQEQGEKAEAPS